MSITVQERYAKLLEREGRAKEALTVFAAIRRQDLNHGDVNTRIETLKRQLSGWVAGEVVGALKRLA